MRLDAGSGFLASAREAATSRAPDPACHATQNACLPWQAPIGHRQPRLTNVGKLQPLPSDLELQALDRALDKKLTICRGC